jgi:hypothetical protein
MKRGKCDFCGAENVELILQKAIPVPQGHPKPKRLRLCEYCSIIRQKQQENRSHCTSWDKILQYNIFTESLCLIANTIEKRIMRKINKEKI